MHMHDDYFTAHTSYNHYGIVLAYNYVMMGRGYLKLTSARLVMQTGDSNSEQGVKILNEVCNYIPMRN